MKLLLWGAGAQGRVVHELAGACGYTDIAFLDDRAFLADRHRPGPVRGSPVFRPGEEGAAGYRDFIICIGDNVDRAHCYERARAMGLEPALLIHPTAVVSPTALIGRGSVVMPLVALGAGVSIGEDCILGTRCLIEHDTHISDHVHISPGAIIGGEVSVESFAHAGTGVIVLSRSRVGAESVLGAGSVVIGDVAPGGIVSGRPALRRRLNAHA